MGEIVGAALVAHVPTIVMSEAQRRAMNGGNDTTLVSGLERIRNEYLDRLRPDTIVVFDTHWFTTFEHCLTSHPRRVGHYTSDELPRGMTAMPYDIQGDPELASTIVAVGRSRDEMWVHATEDPYISMHYPTVNLLGLLQRDERWMSVGICQTAEVEDFLAFGEVLGEAVSRSSRRVVLLASGGMSHRFWPLRELRRHESCDPSHVLSSEAREADRRILSWFAQGDHASVVEFMPEYRSVAPEGRFGHYLMMIGAIGGRRCRAAGVQCSDYESAVGTGQVHVFFEQPAGGWQG
ncbi:MAG: catechol 1,2-dioxygenase [Actinomycetota bacterium]|nr:catechol 1,2-dioxygenase [Actinomycetota bacterium]